MCFLAAAVNLSYITVDRSSPKSVVNKVGLVVRGVTLIVGYFRVIVLRKGELALGVN